MHADAVKDHLPQQQLHFVDGIAQDALPVADRGLAYGDGLFETLRARRGNMPLWARHWARLARGAQVLGLRLQRNIIEEHIKSAAECASAQGLEDLVIKLIVTRGEGGRGYVPAEPSPARIIVTARPCQPLSGGSDSPHKGIELRVCEYRLRHNSILAGIKHLNRLEQVLAAQSVSLSPAQQGLVLDVGERLVETLHHNIFLVRDQRLLTPDLQECGVEGTFRQAIIEQLAPALDLPVEVCDLTLSSLQTADEVFISNAVHGIGPVTAWEDIRWPMGPMTQRLMQCAHKVWNGFYGS